MNKHSLQEIGTFDPLFSVIIPCRNEAEDIAGTLEACLKMDYDRKEIIVVDDSTDQTPEVVARFNERGVRLIHREQNSNGCCGARNLGMKTAKGEIIVLMNADDRPRPDFLKRLLQHYRNGADYVIVASQVSNRDNVWSRYIHATGEAWLSKMLPIEWSEGFSCRREAAKVVGYIPGDFPVAFCRDWKLGDAMNRAGFKKHVDMNIPMEHLSPGTLRSYWNNQIWRGTFSAPFAYYFGNKSVPIILIREILKAGRAVIRHLLILPALIRASRLSAYTDHGWRDVPGLFVAGLVQDVAMSTGNIKGFIRLAQAQNFQSK